MLLNLSGFSGIFLYREAVDFRKSIDGLSSIASIEMGVELKEGNLFVFISRRRDKMKILYFDRTGFALWYKRLERARFKWPKGIENTVLPMEPRQLEWLLEGFDIWKMKPHEALQLNQVL
jgi:transposase